MTDNRDSYAEALERQKQLAQWKEQKKREAQQRENQKKQDALGAYLQRRAQEWIDTTGSDDGLGEQLPRWRAAYLDAREAEAEAERRRKLDEATAHYPGR